MAATIGATGAIDVRVASESRAIPSLGPRTRFAHLGPGPARAVLGAYLLVTAVFVAIAISPGRNNVFEQEIVPGKGDVQLYLDMAHSVQSGKGYYETVHAELQRGSYPTSSVFNWRTPLPIWAVGQFSNPNDARWLIGPFAVLLIIGSLFVMGDETEGGAALGLASSFLVFTTVAQTFSESVFILPVNWAGVFIGLSMCCFAKNRQAWGIALGTVAAILRDLAIGYALTMLCWAVWNRRWKEAAGWCLSIAVFAAWFGWHSWMVSQTMQNNDITSTNRWIAFGGLTFLVSTAQMNVALINLPQWIAAIYLSTGLLGLAGWHTPFGQRVLVAIGAYHLVFLAIGRPFNQYWGLLIAPLLAMGVVRGLLSLKELVQACRTTNPAIVPATVTSP